MSPCLPLRDWYQSDKSWSSNPTPDSLTPKVRNSIVPHGHADCLRHRSVPARLGAVTQPLYDCAVHHGYRPAVSAAKCDRCLSGSDGDFPVMADQRSSLSCEATVTMNST